MEDTSKMRVIVRPTGFSYGVRNDSGFQCFIPSVYHYTGQDARYEKELAEAREKACLFAAAPELLAALIEVVEISDRKHDAWDRAKAAIEKATKTDPLENY